MKHILHLFIGGIALLLSCSGGEQKKQAGNDTIPPVKAPAQPALHDDTPPVNAVAISDSSILRDFPDLKAYRLSDTIRVDLNGDSLAEKAYFLSKGQMKQIAIRDGRSGKELILGGDRSFADIGDDFSWVNAWGTTAVKETYEIETRDGELVGTKKTALPQTSLVVRREETGGGVITFRKGKYVWVHQAD